MLVGSCDVHFHNLAGHKHGSLQSKQHFARSDITPRLPRIQYCTPGDIANSELMLCNNDVLLGPSAQPDILSETVLLKSDSCSQPTYTHAYLETNRIYKLLYNITFYCGETEGTYSWMDMDKLAGVEQI